MNVCERSVPVGTLPVSFDPRDTFTREGPSKLLYHHILSLLFLTIDRNLWSSSLAAASGVMMTPP